MNTRLTIVSLAAIATLLLITVTALSFQSASARDKTEEEVEAKIFKKYEERLAECTGQSSEKCSKTVEKCNDLIAKNEQQANVAC